MKNVIYKIIFAIFVVITVFGLNRLLTPKYMSHVVEGSLIETYYEEEKNHDVIFIGDCEVYESFSPVILWEEYGINSFIRGSAQQLIWQSYYLLEETLRYEKPDVVVFNVLSMKYDTPQREEYNRMTLDGMKWSKSKYDAIQASMMEEEKLIEYMIPFLRYHSRWNQLEKDDFTYFLEKEKLFHNGYYMRVDVKPVEYIPRAKKLPEYKFGENSYYYLDMMVALCKKNDIELILMKAPTLYPHWYDEWDEQMVAYAKRNEVKYINYLDVVEEIGIDFEKDTYDGGLHMNLTGAEKVSRYLGEILQKEYALED